MYSTLTMNNYGSESNLSDVTFWVSRPIFTLRVFVADDKYFSSFCCKCLNITEEIAFGTSRSSVSAGFSVSNVISDVSSDDILLIDQVVFTKKKEFRWERLSLFLKVGVTRKSMQGSRALNDDASLDIIPNRNTSAFDVANLVLRLLPSKQGVVLRRLLMTADGASLIRAMVSKEGGFFRQQLSGIIAEILYQWMLGAIGRSTRVAQYSSRVKLASGTSNYELGPSSGRSMSIYDYQSIFRDRRLRVIFSKALRSAQSDPVLMLRFCWSSLVIFVTASALACHRVVVNLSEAYLGPLSFVPKRFAIST